MEIEQEAMLEIMPRLAGKLVLDLACGTGRWGKIAQAEGANCVLGLDNSFAMLQHGVLADCALSDMTALPLPTGSFDVVICGLAVGHLPTEKFRVTLCEIGRVLKEGGEVVLSDFHPFQAWSGAKRTFEGQDGKTYAIEHYIHRYSDYHMAARQAQLQIIEVREPVYQHGMPVVLVFRLTKKGLYDTH